MAPPAATGLGEALPLSTQPLVLVADDEPRITKLVSIALGGEGFRVITAQDGEEAVAAAAAAPYDLILLDIRMPRLDGLQAAERIRAGRGPSAAAPIIALSAEPDEQGRAKALESGMDDFLTKPIDAARLLTVAARFTERPNPATFAGE